jgi:hypothetical protein
VRLRCFPPSCEKWFLIWIVAACTAACGSTSSSTVTGPSPAKCAVTTSPATSSFAAAGGAGTVTVSAARECGWTGSSQAAWIVLAEPTSGRGDGTLRYTVTANDAGSARRGSVTISDHVVEVAQEAAPCRFSAGRQRVDFGGEGGAEDVSITGPAGCTWSATIEGDWLSLEGPRSGSGSARLTVRAAANQGPGRDGAIVVAGLRIVVHQEAQGAPPPPPAPPEPTPQPDECAFTLTPGEASFPANGGDATVSVGTRADCGWTATSDALWLSIRSAARGTGPAEVTYRVAPNGDAQSRTAHVTIGTAALVVSQAGITTPPPCTFKVDPTQASVPAAGGPVTVHVDSRADCSWTAESNTSWITVAPPSSAGTGDVVLTVAASSETSKRRGTVTVAGKKVTVEQAAAAPPEPVCTYTLTEQAASVISLGGIVTFGVRAPAGCSWTAESQTPWITVTQGATGSGDGEVRALVAPSLDLTERTGTIVAGQQTFTVTQAALLPTGDLVDVDGEVDRVRGDCPDRRFDVDRRTVRASAATAYENGDCDALKKHARVQVHGRERQDNDIDAIQIVFATGR